MTHPRRILWFAVFVAALLLLPTSAAAQSGTVTDDGFISGNATTQKANLGGYGPSIIVAGASATVGTAQVGQTKGFIKFQLQSSLPPLPPTVAATDVVKATLKLFISPCCSPTGSIAIYQVTSAWTEATLNATTPPALASTPFASGIQVGNPDSFVVVDLTALVKEWLNTSANGGIDNDGIALVAETSTTNVAFDSKDSVFTSHEPRLEIILANSGPPGAAATIQVGLTKTLGPNGQASVTNSGTSSAAILNFAIPQGQPGATGQTGPAGQAATINVGTVLPVPYYAAPAVMNGGTANAAVLNFLMPQGQPGAPGAAGAPGPQGPQGPVGLNNRGAWNSPTAYNPNDAVFDSASYWLATAANTGSEPSATNTNWQLLAAGINNRGAWNAANSYNVNDAVSDAGSYWLALVPTSANTAAPNTSCQPSLAACAAEWQLLAAQGAPGQQGSNGAPGAAGQSVATSPEPTGANCAYAGAKFVAANSTTYACNGVPGAPGQSVTSTTLPVGDPNCPFGGTRFVTISGTTYACSGGASMTFRTISGTLGGLAASTSVVLRDNGADDLTLTSNGAFTFATPLSVGASYAVTVATQPSNGTCTVTNGTGTVGGSNVTNVGVTCSVPIVVTTLASGQDHPSAIAVDGNNVYWADVPPAAGGAPGIMSVPLAGGTVSPLVPGSVIADAIAIDLSNLYYTGNNALNRIPKGGGAPPTLVANPLLTGSPYAPFPPFFGLAIDAQNAYVSNSTNIVKAVLAGNAGSVFVSVPSGSQPYAIALDNANVYWTETSGVFTSGTGGAGRVMKAPKVGGTPTVIAQGQNFPADLAVDANNVYWTNNGDGTVMVAPLAGGPPTVIASGQSFPFGIAIDQTNVYWTNNGTSSGGTVMKAPISGGAATVIASGQNFPMAIAVDQTSVYWTNNGGPNAPTGAAATGTVMKANK